MLKLDGQKIIEEKIVKMVTFHNYKVTVENKSYYMGYTDNADIWSITAYGKDEEELFKNLASEFFVEHFGNIINPEWFQFDKVEIISIVDIEKGWILNQIETEEPIIVFNNDTNDIMRKKFYESSYYKEAKENYHKQQKELEDKKRKEQEEKEKAEFKRLSEKYGNKE